MTGWNSDQLEAWERGSWASELDDQVSVNTNQTIDENSGQSSEEDEGDIEEEVAPAAGSQAVDDDNAASPLMRTLIDSIESLRQQLREAQIETHSRLAALSGDLRSSQLEVHSRIDAQDRFIQNLVDEIFRRINRNGRVFNEQHRELVLLVHHLLLILVEQSDE